MQVTTSVLRAIMKIRDAHGFDMLIEVVENLRLECRLPMLRFRPVSIDGHTFIKEDWIGSGSGYLEPEIWHDEKTYASLVMIVKASNLPVVWDEADSKGPAVEQLSRTLKAGGKPDGCVSLPLHGPLREFSILTYALPPCSAEQNPSEILMAEAVLWSLGFHIHSTFKNLWRERTAKGPHLTVRERECLMEAGRGFKVKEIAHRKRLATATVNAHLTAARFKLGASNTVEAAVRAVDRGLIELPEGVLSAHRR